MNARRALSIVVALLLGAGLAEAQTPGAANSFGAPGAAPAPRVIAPTLLLTPPAATPSPPMQPAPRIAPPTLPVAAAPAPALSVQPRIQPPHRPIDQARAHERADSRRHWRRHRPVTPYEIAPPDYQGLTPAPWAAPTLPPPSRQPDYFRPHVKQAPVTPDARRCVLRKKKVWRQGRFVRRWTRVCR